MSTTIYYFSATGNSMTTARMISEAIEGSRLVSVASKKNSVNIKEDADRVGFVFPIYYGNMPYSVREMIGKMTFKPGAYVFIVSTYRGHSGAIANRMDQLLKTRGASLSLSLGLPMPGNSFINPPEKDAEYLEKQRANVANIIAEINKGEVKDYSTNEVLKATPVDIADNFRKIMADETCSGCGLCAMVCPRNNIKVVNGRAEIGNDCATCLACFHWCNKEAIYMSNQEGIERRAKYHHPDVTVQDMILQKYDEEE